MAGPCLLDRGRAVLVVIDVQEAYRSVLYGWAAVERSCQLAVRGAALLGLPIVVTEQYPRGLGATSPAILDALPASTRRIQKMTMSCCGAAEFMQQLEQLGRGQVLVTGIETHACVSQTVQDLCALDFEVHVAQDATSSRREELVAPAWDRMMRVGALPTTVEQALLEGIRSAEAPEFRSLQQLLKAAAPT